MKSRNKRSKPKESMVKQEEAGRVDARIESSICVREDEAGENIQRG